MSKRPEHTRLRLALCQINPTVGDIDGNTELLISALNKARDGGAQIALAPELAVCGYPPEDLLAKPHFADACAAAVSRIAAACPDLICLVGYPERDGALYNSLAVLSGGEVCGTYRKTLLPNYGVFDERRFFEPGDKAGVIAVGDVLIGLTVCEDIWFAGPPAASAARAGAGLILNASASPYHRGKGIEREEMVQARARENEVGFALCNLAGAQDELVFDGHSVVVGHGGETLARARQFEQQVVICEIPVLGAPVAPDAPPAGVELIASLELPPAGSPDESTPPLAPALGDLEEVMSALRTGLRDYVAKNGFEHVVLGLSGGIDSALVAVIACDTLGPDRVTCVSMPSPFSSGGTQEDARELARRLGCEFREIPIEPVMNAFHAALAPELGADWSGVAFENIQARIRGSMVMALSNHHGWLALSTGNKSEMAVGYATLYGDMAGGFALIKDVPKTLVYELCRARNDLDADAPEPVIPVSIIERAPSAELRPDQLDTDSLPPYAVLDEIIERYVERDQSPAAIAEAISDRETAERIAGMIDRAEYKRRQAPPGVKITPRAFGRDRRLPITNRFGA